MCRTLVALALLPALGCVPSKNPFYLPEDALFVQALMGEWHGVQLGERNPEAQKYTFAKGEAKTFLWKPESGEETVSQLFRLGGHYYLDLIIEEGDKPAHMLFKASLVGNRLELSIIDPSWLGRLLHKDPKLLAHEPVEGKQQVKLLTAPTEHLRAFVAKYAEDPNAFGKFMRLTATADLPVAREGFGSRAHRTADYWYEVCMTARSTWLY